MKNIIDRIYLTECFDFETEQKYVDIAEKRIAEYIA